MITNLKFARHVEDRLPAHPIFTNSAGIFLFILPPMYNKLFAKILDSSIWLEPTTTRIVWITLIAAMDQDGYAHFSAIENLASRARVTVTECNAALECLMSPDKNSADSDFEGRRIERIPGGFLILNALKYRNIVNAITSRESTRLRVQKFRAKKANETPVTVSNGVKRNVTPSETETYSDSAAEANSNKSTDGNGGTGEENFALQAGSVEKAKKKKAAKVVLTDDEWFKTLEASDAYKGIQIRVEYSKMEFWCIEKKCNPSRRRFLNWLNKAEKPMVVNGLIVAKPLSIMERQTIIKAKETIAAELKRRFSSEVAMGIEWSDMAKKQEWMGLRKDINRLTNELGRML